MIIKVSYFVLEVENIATKVQNFRYKATSLCPAIFVSYVKKMLKA